MGLKGDFLMGLCADIWFVPADKMGALQILRSSGDGNQGIRSLLSHAGFCIRDIVRRFRIQLRMRQHPHSLAAAVRALRLCGRYVSRQNERKARTAV